MLAEFLVCGEQYAQGHALRGLRNFGQFRKGGGNTNRTVIGIFPVWMRRSSRCKFDTCFFGESDNPLGAALGNGEADEVTAPGPGPSYVGDMDQVLTEHSEHLLEFGRDHRSVSVH